MVIGSNVVQAAITQVDASTGCKFTASILFLVEINHSTWCPPSLSCALSQAIEAAKAAHRLLRLLIHA
jgi:hypothetical protein